MFVIFNWSLIVINLLLILLWAKYKSVINLESMMFVPTCWRYFSRLHSFCHLIKLKTWLASSTSDCFYFNIFSKGWRNWRSRSLEWFIRSIEVLLKFRFKSLLGIKPTYFNKRRVWQRYGNLSLWNMSSLTSKFKYFF